MMFPRSTYDYQFNSLFSQSLGGGLGSITSDTTDPKLLGQDGVGEDGADDGAALLASGAENGKDLRHDCCGDGDVVFFEFEEGNVKTGNGQLLYQLIWDGSLMGR